MKKKLLYILLVVFFIGSVGFIVLKHNKNEQQKEAMVYNLLPRNGDLAKADEWANTQRSAALLLQKIKANPADKKIINSPGQHFYFRRKSYR